MTFWYIVAGMILLICWAVVLKYVAFLRDKLDALQQVCDAQREELLQLREDNERLKDTLHSRDNEPQGSMKQRKRTMWD